MPDSAVVSPDVSDGRAECWLTLDLQVVRRLERLGLDSAADLVGRLRDIVVAGSAGSGARPSQAVDALELALDLDRVRLDVSAMASSS